MRLPKPGVLPNLFKRQQNSELSSPSRTKKILKSGLNLLLVAVLAVVVIGAINKYKYKESKHSGEPENSASATIRLLKDSKNLDDQRSVASDYLLTGNFAEAERVARGVAEQTNNVNDYLTLLNICATRSVPNKQACLNYSVDKIRPQIDNLSFYSTYTAGSALDEAGDKKNAVVFYQRAYDIYDPARADAYTKTKAQLKQRIAELNG